MWRKEVVAMILAGGQGSRLGVLTRDNAKPGVPFGGKFRIIDFVLSNCKRSALDTVGVLTQYKPLHLNKYLANGTPWNLDSYHGGLYILPPYVTEEGGNWYEGTADAIYQNLDYLEQYKPEYVLVLSGDHIYTMDYRKMIDAHKKTQADLTIAVLEVPWEEASRFGVMSIDDENRINLFEEKADQPSSNLASMGIYVFNYELLKKYLQADSLDDKSEHDFGKNVIPKMLAGGQRLFAYKFEGYWRDVGTIESYYQANMDLLEEIPALNDILFGDEKVYSNYKFLPPHYVGADARVEKSIVADGSTILGKLKRTIIFPGAFIGKDVSLENSIVLPNCKLDGRKTYKDVIITEEEIVIEISEEEEAP